MNIIYTDPDRAQCLSNYERKENIFNTKGFYRFTKRI